jgi:hypothetical protein
MLEKLHIDGETEAEGGLDSIAELFSDPLRALA